MKLCIDCVHFKPDYSTHADGRPACARPGPVSLVDGKPMKRQWISADSERHYKRDAGITAVSYPGELCGEEGRYFERKPLAAGGGIYTPDMPYGGYSTVVNNTLVKGTPVYDFAGARVPDDLTKITKTYKVVTRDEFNAMERGTKAETFDGFAILETMQTFDNDRIDATTVAK